MTIQMTDDVKVYLTKKHKDSLEVYVHRLYYGKGGPMRQAEVITGEPFKRNLEHFETFNVDGFTVYVEEPLVDEHDLTIKLDHTLGIKHLEVVRE